MSWTTVQASLQPDGEVTLARGNSVLTVVPPSQFRMPAVISKGDSIARESLTPDRSLGALSFGILSIVKGIWALAGGYSNGLRIASESNIVRDSGCQSVLGLLYVELFAAQKLASS